MEFHTLNNIDNSVLGMITRNVSSIFNSYCLCLYVAMFCYCSVAGYYVVSAMLIHVLSLCDIKI